MDKYKIGDRVRSYVGVGTVVAINDPPHIKYTVQYDNFTEGHDGRTDSDEDGEIYDRWWNCEENLIPVIEVTDGEN